MVSAMAIAGRMAAERFNTADFSPIDHTVYALAGDGDLQEGISYEAAALAGHLKLGNMVYIYDDNGITIEGKTNLAWSEDVAGRFNACGWHVQKIDGHDYVQIMAAIAAAKAETGRPSIIIATTHIAFGSPGKQDSSGAHGSPLGKDEIAATRANLGWRYAPFEVPEEVHAVCRDRVEVLKGRYTAWQRGFSAWHAANPEKAKLWDEMWNKRIPATLADELIAAIAGKDGATRSLSGAVLQKAAALIPALVGGSADLTPSTNSDIKGSPSVQPGEFAGRNLHFGVREHAMGAVVNGMGLYGCFIPYGATFLVFSDYCRPAIRLSALMKLAVDLHLYPRLLFCRRGWADPSADRTRGLAPHDSRPATDPPGRRPGNGAGLAGGIAAQQWADSPDPHPPEAAGHRPSRLLRQRRCAQGRLCRCHPNRKA